MTDKVSEGFAEVRDIATQFVRARLAGTSLPDFPGRIPATIDLAYGCQNAAIVAWPDTIQGWKVGRILEPWFSRLGEDRLVGPIFKGGVRFAQTADSSAPLEIPVFVGGFAAVEAEFIVKLGADAPAHKTQWKAEEARELVAALHVGIETAGSPLATINDLGPLVVISDLGNNAGLIVGAEIPNWRSIAPEHLASETWVEDRRVGVGSAASVPGGPMGGLAFALNRCARRGLPLQAGQWISTGATTGIHDIRAGQSAKAVFAGVAEISCRAVPAQPTPSRKAAP